MPRDHVRGAAVAVLVAAMLLAAAGVGAARAALQATSSKQVTVTITTRAVPKLGTILVDATGKTLYMFVPDEHHAVTCKGTGASIWPPVKLPSGGKAAAAGKAKASLLGSDKDPSGGRVVTYGGWPLYTYVADTRAGVATGQDRDLNGGLWYALAPSGKVIRTA
jgi:predicted lipoprotein with Yx(FWY)xxD motif